MKEEMSEENEMRPINYITDDLRIWLLFTIGMTILFLISLAFNLMNLDFVTYSINDQFLEALFKSLWNLAVSFFNIKYDGLALLLIFLFFVIEVMSILALIGLILEYKRAIKKYYKKK